MDKRFAIKLIEIFQNLMNYLLISDNATPYPVNEFKCIFNKLS